jgi:hypothetical protein
MKKENPKKPVKYCFTKVLLGICSIYQVANADTLKLNDGEKIEGRVIRETEESYLVEVIGEGAFKEERIISKKDVKSIEKEEADSIAFGKLSSLVPTPDLLKATEYDERIELVENFLREHPKSAKVNKAKDLLEELSAESDVIRGGGVKFGGAMVSGEEYAANAYEYDAVIAEKLVVSAIQRRELLGALRLFAVYDSKFKDADGRGALAAKMKHVLAALSRAVEASIAGHENLIAKREAGLAQMAPQDRTNAERAIAEQNEKLQKRYESEKATPGTWVTPDEYHKESLEECKRQIESEMNRIEASEGKESTGESLAEMYRATWEKIVKVTDEEKKGILDELKRVRLPEEYIEKIAKRGEAAPEVNIENVDEPTKVKEDQKDG